MDLLWKKNLKYLCYFIISKLHNRFIYPWAIFSEHTWLLHRSSTFSAAIELNSWGSFSWLALWLEWCPFSVPCLRNLYTCSMTFFTCIKSLGTERASLRGNVIGYFLLQQVMHTSWEILLYTSLRDNMIGQTTSDRSWSFIINEIYVKMINSWLWWSDKDSKSLCWCYMNNYWYMIFIWFLLFEWFDACTWIWMKIEG